MFILETWWLSKIEGPALYLMIFLVNIFTEINHRKKSMNSLKTCFYLFSRNFHYQVRPYVTPTPQIITN